MKKKFILLLGFIVFSMGAQAGPVFQTVGGGGIAPPHPNGDDSGDRMIVSNSWGISGTGGGFMNGRITFSDSLVLPGIGGTLSFSASDITELFYDHTVAAGTLSIAPSILFTADQSQITSASGDIIYDGFEFALANVEIVTNITTTWSVPLYGLVIGDWVVEDTGLRVGTSGLRLLPGSTTSGRWELDTTATTVPEPSTFFLLAPALGLIFSRRKKPLQAK